MCFLYANDKWLLTGASKFLGFFSLCDRKSAKKNHFLPANSCGFFESKQVFQLWGYMNKTWHHFIEARPKTLRLSVLLKFSQTNESRMQIDNFIASIETKSSFITWKVISDEWIHIILFNNSYKIISNKGDSIASNLH